MFLDIDKLYKSVYATAFLGCLAVLPMSDTIALRNILLVSMVLLIFGGIIFSSDIRHHFALSSKIIPIPLVLWVVYLFVFPFWAPIPEIAWENVRGQWGESVVAWIAGLGAAVILSGTGLSLWKLGFASAFPILVHLSLAGVSYLGLFSSDYYAHQNLSGLISEAISWTSGEFNPTWRYNPLDTGFRGIESQPGNIGYASSVAIGIFSILFLTARRTGNWKEMIIAFGLVGLCFLSILAARTRGGLIFGLLMIGLAAIFVNLSTKSISLRNPRSDFLGSVWSYRSSVVYLLIVIIGCLVYFGTKADPRWTTMVDKVQAGFSITDPIASLCNGLSHDEEFTIRYRLAAKSPTHVEEVIGGVKGQDGGRVILMRAGMQLVLENPLGLDGSRQSYERLIRVKCNGTPELNFANSHNSWIDLSLALGWTGGALFFTMLLYFIRYSLVIFGDEEYMPVIATLGLLAVFWLIRGLFDTLYREHYLQMQGLIISYLYMTIALKFSLKNPARTS